MRATLLAVVLAVVAHLAVPCTGQQQCSSQQSQTLAEVSSVQGTNFMGPTVAQRISIRDSPVIITKVFFTLSSQAIGTVEAQIRLEDASGLPGALVSSQYVAQVETLASVSETYTFVFANDTDTELAANTYYWIVFTSPAVGQAQWVTGTVDSTAITSINVDAGSAYASAESIPAEQVPNVSWTENAPGTVILTLTINGCVTAAVVPSSTPIVAPSISAQPPSASPSAIPAAPTSSLTPRSSRTPQASASATPTPVVLVPITANVTSSFDSTQTALNLTAPSSGNGTSGSTQPGVTVVSQFSEVQLGNRTLPPPAIQELTVSNDTSTNATTYTYASQLENTTSVEQAFTFFDRKTSANFAGLEFDISASSVKWSIHLQSNSTTSDGLTLRYRLTGLTVLNGGNSTTSQAVASRGRVVVQRETPRANMTTYLVPLFVTSSTNATTTTNTRTTAAQVELFDVALIDGTHFVPIGHSIVRIGENETAEYMVELVLPGFNESLFYDPSIGLGVLLGRNDRDDGGGGSESNVGLIVGVAVAVPVAVALVLVVIGAALVIAWRQKLLARRNAGSINFGGDTHDHDDRL